MYRVRSQGHDAQCGIGAADDQAPAAQQYPFEKWFDIDFPEVIEIRKEYFYETEKYKMLGASASETDWIFALPDFENAVIVLEGISMYLSEEIIRNLFAAISEKFPNAEIIMDVYTEKAVKASKIKNPIKDVGALPSFGINEPFVFETEKVKFSGEIEMTPEEKINELSGFEKAFFKKMFAGKLAKNLYKIFTYRI